MIILPGGWDGTYALADDVNVQRILKEMDAKGRNIAAICAAPFALNKAGVLKHNFTCYPSLKSGLLALVTASKRSVHITVLIISINIVIHKLT